MKVYRYGLLAPIEGAEIVASQMRAAHAYRNRLIEIVRRQRAAVRAAEPDNVRDAAAVVARAKSALDDALASVAKVRKSTHDRSESPAQRLAVKECRSALRESRRVLSELRREARAGMQSVRDASHEAMLAERRDARASCGVYWGTYQLAEDAVDRAASDTPLWDGAVPSDPRFLGFRGDGAVSVQVVGGLPVADMLDGGSQQVFVSDPEFTEPDRRDPTSRRSQLRKRIQLWLRVSSGEGRSPVWAKWPMVLHRPLPADGVIKRATVHLRHIGPRPEWCVTFTVDEPAVASTGNQRAVAIDVGWRQLGDSLRVGVGCDGDGTVFEIALPERIATGIQKADDLRSTRDRNFDEAKAELARWLGERATTVGVAWIVDATTTMHAWRSPGRLAALVIRWRNERIEGDGVAFAAVEAWRLQDRHLWLWETSQRTGSLRARKDWYRVQAAKIAERYGTLILEDFDLRSVARLPNPEAAAENGTSRSNRQLASVSEFRDCLRNAFRSRGGEVVTVPAEYTTRTCSVCGVVEAFDAAAMLRHQCENGHEWDQDENAARNLIERWRGAPKPAAASEPDAKGESRRDRVRRLREEKRARMDRSKDGGKVPASSEVA